MAGGRGEGQDLDVAGRGGFEGGASGLDGGVGECGLGAEKKKAGLGCKAEELAGGWGPEMGVEDDAQERSAARQAGAIGEGGVVGEDGANAGEDGVGGVAEVVDLSAGERAGEPDGGGGGAGDGRWGETAVNRERRLEGDEGALALDKVGERQVEGTGRALAGAEGDCDAGVAENGEATAADERVGIGGSNDDASDAGLNEGDGAGTGPAVVRAGLEGDEGGGAADVMA